MIRISLCEQMILSKSKSCQVTHVDKFEGILEDITEEQLFFKTVFLQRRKETSISTVVLCQRTGDNCFWFNKFYISNLKFNKAHTT